jgi:cell division protein FtsI (penicillin-binding protein 3)
MAVQVISKHTSDDMRYLMRLNAEQGSAKMAMEETRGYGIGGKTGTANKVIDGRYSRDKVLTDFTAVFPFWAPRYTVLVLYDEPKALPSTHGFHTAAWNAGVTAGKVILRIAPLLGIHPNPDVPPNLPPDGVNLAESRP